MNLFFFYFLQFSMSGSLGPANMGLSLGGHVNCGKYAVNPFQLDFVQDQLISTRCSPKQVETVPLLIISKIR
jgi:hypothetical protein